MSLLRPRTLLAAAGTALASYHFVDRHVSSGVSYTYGLVHVGLDGARTRAGGVALRAR